MEYDRYPRPDTVKMISYALLAEAVLGIFYLVYLLAMRPALAANVTILACTAVGSVLTAICGWYLLRGANWARILFFAGHIPIVMVLLCAMYGVLALVGLIIPLLVSLYLIGLPANRFFTHRDTLSRNPKVQRAHKGGNREREGRYDY
jgi:hypothetical protein